MPTPRHASHNPGSRAQRQPGHACDRGDHRSPDPGWCQRFPGTPEIRSLFEWVRRNIRYTRDIFRVELLHTARRMLELRAGDCDDMTILLGAMLMATGHPVRLALVGFRKHKPHCYSHIYLEANLGGNWIALDATMERPLGWAPPAIWKRICEIERGGLQCSRVT